MRILLILAVLTTFAPAQSPPSPTTLANLRDTYRPLLIFADRPDSPYLLIQFRNLNNAAADLAQRNVIVIAVPFDNPAPTPVALTAEAALQARRRFNIPPTDFTVLLLGKDGEEKFRSTKPISIQRLDNVIDAMPMRQQEMKSRAPQ